MADSTKINWQKIIVYFLLYSTGVAAIDYAFGGTGEIDINRAIAVPLIAIALLFLVNKKRFLISDNEDSA